MAELCVCAPQWQGRQAIQCANAASVAAVSLTNYFNTTIDNENMKETMCACSWS